ncbi:MAG: ABC transporter ATP-binding protein/permease [Roseburia sp.]|nr:ABC transporter ATP-binding protein/permease [Roseburia sp.]
MKYKSKLQINLKVLTCGRLAAVIFILCRLLAGVLLPFTAYAFQKLIDEIISSFQARDTDITFVIPLLMVVGIYFFQALEEPVEKYCEFILRQRLNYWFDTSCVDKLKRIKYSHFEDSKDLDLINRIDGTAGNEAVDLFDNTLNLVSGMIQIVGTFILLSTYNFLISIVVVFVAIPIMIVSAKYGKLIHDWYEKNSKARRRLTYLSSIFVDRTAAFEMKEYNYYDYLNTDWRNQFKDLRNKDFKLQIKAWKNTIASGLLLNLFEYVTYLIMLLPTASGTITIGAFVGLSKAISSIEGLILWRFSSLFVFLSKSTEYWEDYNRFLDLEEVQIDRGGAASTHKQGVSIEFKNVSFRYENMETDVLSGVSFRIQSGELCGLVGVNGAGKSTLVKLMLGLYKPTSGEIWINNKNTRDMSFDEQAGYFGVTYQDFSRYNISILDNITLSPQSDEREKVEDILASLDFDHTKFPSGIDTLVGHSFGNGIDLSGGEWQKIAIARMLYTNRPFYIMDEPTASLDPMSEAELYKQIQTVFSGKTSLLISHRLGATVMCDNLIVLNDGKIVESGTFSELLERGGIYAKMYNEQKQWYER